MPDLNLRVTHDLAQRVARLEEHDAALNGSVARIEQLIERVDARQEHCFDGLRQEVGGVREDVAGLARDLAHHKGVWSVVMISATAVIATATTWVLAQFGIHK